jgi:hypothetical protein
MLLHVVMFRPRPGLATADREQLAAALAAAINLIPRVRGVGGGRRVPHGRPYEQLMRADYSHIALLEFDDLAGLKAYLEHSVHDQLGRQFFAAFEEALMYDYEVGEGDDGIRSLTTA